MTEFILQLNCRFSDDDKEKCIPVIERLIILSESVRRHGILALQSEMEREQDVFVETASSLVVDGVDPAAIKQILYHLILADRAEGEDLLKKLLYTQGFLSIQNGDNPRIVRLKLCSMLGEKYIERMRGAPMAIEIASLIRALQDRTPLPESISFEAFLLRQPDPSIERVLRDVDGSNLIWALQGCGIDLIRKITDNLSKYVAFQLCAALQPPREGLPIDRILSAQKTVLETIDKLESFGEIIVVRY